MKEQLNKRIRCNKTWHRNENRNKLPGKELSMPWKKIAEKVTTWTVKPSWERAEVSCHVVKKKSVDKAMTWGVKPPLERAKDAVLRYEKNL
jgi:hypothetical protein